MRKPNLLVAADFGTRHATLAVARDLDGCFSVARHVVDHPASVPEEEVLYETYRTVRKIMHHGVGQRVVFAIEGYAYGKGYRAHGMGQMGGALRMAAYWACAELVVVPPTTIKKFATGKGNADKFAMLGSAIRKLRVAENDQHYADARWLLEMMLCHYWTGTIDTTEYQKEVLAKGFFPA